MRNKILHIVDMQRDFIMPDGKLSVAGAAALIKPANTFIKSVPFDHTIATFDTHYNETYSNSAEAQLFPPHCIYGTPGWELAIDTGKYEPIKKEVFDVWSAQTAIKSALRYFAPKNTDIYIMGVASDFCVKYAIAGYLANGYRVIVLRDLCRGIERQIDNVVADDFKKQNIKIINSIQLLKKQKGK